MKNFLLVMLCVACPCCCLFATADKNADEATKVLLFHLKHTLAGEGILIGHQNDVISGISNGGWKDNVWQAAPDTVWNSDIWQICGDYPAVHGFDIGGINVDPWHQNLDWHNLAFMKNAIIQAYHRKAVITIGFHMFNPFTTKSGTHTGPWLDKGFEELENPFPEILETGTAYNDTLNVFLTRAANYLNSLKTTDTIPTPLTTNPNAVLVREVTVPVIFRPFHEMNAGSFWWGPKACTADQYIDLWRYAFTYLTDTLQVHNLLYCWSPYGKETESQYLSHYPGDAYVDILGFEANNLGKEFYYTTQFNNMVDVVFNLAQLKGKPFALCENGIYTLTDSAAGPTYFTDYFEWLYNDNEARYLSYILFWRNAGNGYSIYDEFKVPYPGNELADDFLAVYESPHLAKFESDMQDLVFNNSLGPYMMKPEDFPTLYGTGKREKCQVTYKNGMLRVAVAETSNFMVQLYSLNGSELYAFSCNGNVAQKLLPLTRGVYLIQIISGKEKWSTKIAVN